MSRGQNGSINVIQPISHHRKTLNSIKKCFKESQYGYEKFSDKKKSQNSWKHIFKNVLTLSISNSIRIE